MVVEFLYSSFPIIEEYNIGDIPIIMSIGDLNCVACHVICLYVYLHDDRNGEW